MYVINNVHNMKNVVDSGREGEKNQTNQLRAGFTRRDVLALL